MAYVPDYIRPITTKTSPTGPALSATPTHNYARRTASFAVGSGHSSSSGHLERPSSIQSPSSDDGVPVFSSARRRSATHPAPPFASRFYSAPQERVCGRVSIKERLRSLESEAAVKLELRPTQTRSRRRGSNQDSPRIVHRNISSDSQVNDKYSSAASSRSGSRRSSTKLDSDVPSLKEEPEMKVNGKPSSMPKPDIIESHQPKILDPGSQVKDKKTERSKPYATKTENNIIETPKSRNERKLSDSKNTTETPKSRNERKLSDSKIVSEKKSKTRTKEPSTTLLKAGESKVQHRTKPVVTGNKVGLNRRRGSKDALEVKPSNNDFAKSRDELPRLDTHTPYCSTESKNNKIMAPKAVFHSASDGNTSTDSSNENKLNKTRKTEQVKTSPSSKQNSLVPHIKEASKSGSDFKPIWRTPSMKQMQRPDVEKKSTKEKISTNELENVDRITTTSKPVSTIESNQNNAIIGQELDKSHKVEEDAKILPGTTVDFEMSAPQIDDRGSCTAIDDAHDITTSGTTITANIDTSQPSPVPNIAKSHPVELRSPRNEHGGQVNRRPGARDKRNARVFIMPSSSDSDMDNPMSRMDRDLKKLGGFSRAVDLLPKTTDNVTENNHITTDSEKPNELAIKHVAPVKFVPYVLKSNYLESKSEEKKDSTAVIDDQSSKIYPELLPSSRRKDSKSHEGERRKDSQKSPSRRRKSTRSGRSGYNRSKSTDTRRIGYDVHRYRSNSMSESKRDRSTHRKEAVANAVVYGTSNDLTIPYIDDITTPPNEEASIVAKENFLKVTRRLSLREPKRDPEIASIHRSNSADVLSSHHKVEVSPAKMRRTRAMSADRTTAKGVHRRSYQIATMPVDISDNDPRFKKFHNDSDLDDSMNADRSVDSSLDDQQKTSRSGYLHFKVATIDKGKRTSSQKSWKLVWAAIIDHYLHLSKEWNKSKNMQDAQLSRQLSLHEEVHPLNIQSSLVGIAYNYLKRRNVFKLTTFNGSEYLFQAESRDDMLAWIAAIQKEGCSWEDGAEINEDLILRKTNQIESGPKSDKRVSRKRSPKPNVKNNNLQVKDVDGSRRFKWRGSVNRIVKKFGTGQPFVLSGTFGVHLEDCPPSPVNEFVPFIVELCCRIVEERGLYFTGIYRVPGNNASLSALQDDLNNHGVESIRQDDDRLRDLNVVSSLLKSFFRKLPEPLFTNELYHDFIQASRRPKSDDRLNSLRRLVHMLPGPHYETLKFLICHLRLIADNCQENKMEVRNLAIVFGPTLVRNTAADNTATMVTDMSDQCRIIESIIEHAEWFFSDNADEAAPNVPTRGVAAPPDKEHEAVPSIEFLLDNVGRKPGDTGNTSESAKSKGSDDSEKDSFSRDLMDLLFGKKWKQSGQQPTTVEDHGGFEGYQFTNEIDAVKKKEEVTPDMEARPPKSPSATTTSGIPNVSERLLQFYNEHIERITTIGQTFPAFSSADSSPRTTPRHSTILANPIVFPPPVPQRGRSRISSDSDARHATSSHDVYPSHKTPPFPIQDVATRLNDAPRYKHPPNPYNKNLKESTPTSVISKSTTTFSNSSSTKALLGSHLSSSTPSVVLPLSVYPDAVMEHKNLFPPKYPEPPKIEQKNNIAQNTTETLPVNSKKNTESDMLTTQTKISQLSNNPLGFTHERLVGELPKPAKRVVSPKNSNDSSKSLKQSTPNESDTTSSRKTSTSSLASDNKKTIAQRDATKLSPDVSYRQQKKVRKSPLKENLASGKATTVTSERMFSRYDPKRRGIRFAGNENDQSFSTHGAANTSPAKQLTATERLFNGQQVRRKPSSRENKKNHVIRRHTLSGLQDLEEHASSFANKTLRTNLRQASQNLSMHDLTSMSSSQQQSAIERLNPKGIAPGMTLTNWIRQERMRSKTTQPNGYAVSNKASVIVREKHKESKSQVHSYV